MIFIHIFYLTRWILSLNLSILQIEHYLFSPSQRKTYLNKPSKMFIWVASASSEDRCNTTGAGSADIHELAKVVPIPNINGVCAIIYEKTDEALFFLLFKRNSNWKGWESLKGKCLPNERPEDAIKRVVSEKIKKFGVKEMLVQKRAFPVGGDQHDYAVFLVESYTNIPVNMKEEKKKHDNYIWLSRSEAVSRLQWPEEKAVYDEAVKMIVSKQSTI